MSDLAYFRDVQYRDSSKLAARANLHERYSTASVPFREWIAQQVEWAPGARVLEVGCGAGWLWESARASVPDSLSLTLADLSVGMVCEAVTRVTAHFAFVDGVVLNAELLPFTDASFDVAVANHMLYHVPDPALAAVELARVLRPHGVLLAATNGPSHLVELDAVLVEVFGPRRREPYHERFGPHNGAPMLEPHFETLGWRAFEDTLVCTDADDVLAYLLSYPPGEQADASQIASLRAAIVARIDAGIGAFRVTKEVGAFVCRNGVG